MPLFYSVHEWMSNVFLIFGTLYKFCIAASALLCKKTEVFQKPNF